MPPLGIGDIHGVCPQGAEGDDFRQADVIVLVRLFAIRTAVRSDS